MDTIKIGGKAKVWGGERERGGRECTGVGNGREVREREGEM